MPISPPSFNVPALSPAGLLQRREPPDYFGALLGNLLQASLAEKAQVRAEERAEQARIRAEKRARIEQIDAERRAVAAGQRERFLQDVTSGRIVSVNSLAGMADNLLAGLERVPTPTGKTGEYVRAKDVKEARPLSEIFRGREFTEGTTVGDITDPSSGQLLTNLLPEVELAPKEEIIGLLDSLAKAGGPGTQRAVQVLRDRVANDPVFTQAEKAEVEASGLSLRDFANYDALNRQSNSLEADSRRAFFARRTELLHRYDVSDPSAPGGRRDMTPEEADVAAKVEFGMELPDDANTYGNALWGSGDLPIRMVPSGSPPDIQGRLNEGFIGASNAGSEYFESFVSWLQMHALDVDARGRPVVKDNQLTKDILAATGSPATPETIRDFATKTGLTADYRAAYAISQVQGIHRLSDLNSLVGMGVVLPFSRDAALQGFNKLSDTTFFDAAVGPVISSSGSVGPVSPLTGVEAERTTAAGEAAFTPAREQFLRTFTGASPEIITNLRGTMLSGNNKQVADSLLATARRFERDGLVALATYWRQLAEAAEQSPEQFTIFRDSIVVPMLDSLSHGR